MYQKIIKNTGELSRVSTTNVKHNTINFSRKFQFNIKLDSQLYSFK